MRRLQLMGAVVVAVSTVGWLVPVGSADAAPAPAPRWVQHLGDIGEQHGQATALDGQGNVYVAGNTTSMLPGATSSGSAFVAKYTVDGSLVWVDQYGTLTGAAAITVAPSGEVIVAGATQGTLPGSPDPNAGGADVYLKAYNPDGSLRWVRQLGSTGDDFAASIAADRLGGITVGGIVNGSLPDAPEPYAGVVDLFIARYDSDGNRAWVHLLGSPKFDGGGKVAVDAHGAAYMTGMSYGQVPGTHEHHSGFQNVVLAKYRSDGRRLWVHELGGPLREEGTGIAVDRRGNVWVTGNTHEVLPGSTDPYSGGRSDVFVTKYSSGGTHLWLRELGTNRLDRSYAVAVDAADNAYVVGSTAASLAGAPRSFAGGEFDLFVASYDSTGASRWVEELGSRHRDEALGVAASTLGDTFVTGYTEGKLPYTGPPTATAATSAAPRVKYGSAIILLRYRSTG